MLIKVTNEFKVTSQERTLIQHVPSITTDQHQFSGFKVMMIVQAPARWKSGKRTVVSNRLTIVFTVGFEMIRHLPQAIRGAVELQSLTTGFVHHLQDFGIANVNGRTIHQPRINETDPCFGNRSNTRHLTSIRPTASGLVATWRGCDDSHRHPKSGVHHPP